MEEASTILYPTLQTSLVGKQLLAVERKEGRQSLQLLENRVEVSIITVRSYNHSAICSQKAQFTIKIKCKLLNLTFKIRHQTIKPVFQKESPLLISRSPQG